MKNFIQVFILIVFLLGPSYANNTKNHKAWKVQNNYLTPDCFVYSWYSGDNYELFYEHYFKIEASWLSSEFNQFHDNVGKYLGKEIPLNDNINTGWGDDKQISLTTNLDTCINKEPITEIVKDLAHFSYGVIQNFPTNLCKQLAPNIEHNCSEIKLIKYLYRLGSMGTREQANIYAIYDLKNNTKIILPLKNFDNEAEAKIFLNSL